MVNNNNGFPDPTELVRKQREAHKKESLKATLATWRAEAKFKKPTKKKGIKEQLDEAYIEAFKKKLKQDVKEQEKAILAKKKKLKAKKRKFEAKKRKFEKGIKTLARKRVRMPQAPKRVAKKYIVGKRITYKIGRVR